MAKKLHPNVRKEQILDAAIKVAESVGYANVQRADVAAQANCASGTVNRYYGTMKQLKRDIIRHAIKAKNLIIIMQGIANCDPAVSKIPNDLKQQACSQLINS